MFDRVQLAYKLAISELVENDYNRRDAILSNDFSCPDFADLIPLTGSPYNISMNLILEM